MTEHTKLQSPAPTLGSNVLDSQSLTAGTASSSTSNTTGCGTLTFASLAPAVPPARQPSLAGYWPQGSAGPLPVRSTPAPRLPPVPSATAPMRFPPVPQTWSTRVAHRPLPTPGEEQQQQQHWPHTQAAGLNGLRGSANPYRPASFQPMATRQHLTSGGKLLPFASRQHNGFVPGHLHPAQDVVKNGTLYYGSNERMVGNCGPKRSCPPSDIPDGPRMKYQRVDVVGMGRA
eukprot:EG_transcript_12075